MSAARQGWLEILQSGQTSSPAWQTAFAEFGQAQDIHAATTQQLAGLGLNEATRRRLRHPDQAVIQRWQAWLEEPHHRLLTRDDESWPEQLRASPDAPLALWLRGSQPNLLTAPQIAIVGARSATAGGLANSQAFAQALGDSGLTVTSGLAAGIDAAAHTGALGTTGNTIAVLGNGIDAIYPRENNTLARRLEEQALIVSEYGPGIAAQRHQFPARNRIIASLSLGVLVVEAGSQSGSLITARLAGERGRDIFAIPGSIHNPVARGCHQLIRQGAKLVETASDILLELAPQLRAALAVAARPAQAPRKSPETRHNAAQKPAQPAPEYRELLERMGFDPADVSDIVAQTTLTTAEVSSMLLLLELEGYVEALPGGRYLRVR